MPLLFLIVSSISLHPSMAFLCPIHSASFRKISECQPSSLSTNPVYPLSPTSGLPLSISTKCWSLPKNDDDSQNETLQGGKNIENTPEIVGY
mmetsp:Transcript_11658/g.28043  ORF Transcript_11658/g.28043 Transcript_11658/m.28043 type:complete len:92 (-) Transcript_11658:253-528(-)